MRLATWQGLAPSKIIGWNDAQPAQGPTLACRYRTRRKERCLSLSIHSFLFYWCEWRASSFFVLLVAFFSFVLAYGRPLLRGGYPRKRASSFAALHLNFLSRSTSLCIAQLLLWGRDFEASTVFAWSPIHRILIHLPLRLLTQLADQRPFFDGPVILLKSNYPLANHMSESHM